VRRVLGPRQDPDAKPIAASRRGPSARSDGGLTARSLISGLDSTAFALAVSASSEGSPPPTQDSLLAVGQLYQVGLVTHRVPTKGFRYASSFPNLSGRKNGSSPNPRAPARPTLGLRPRDHWGSGSASGPIACCG